MAVEGEPEPLRKRDIRGVGRVDAGDEVVVRQVGQRPLQSHLPGFAGQPAPPLVAAQDIADFQLVPVGPGVQPGRPIMRPVACSSRALWP